jgi:long-chain fatty acid transport protein
MRRYLFQASILVCFFLAAGSFAPAVHATNGMNLEGYGPIAAGMGGASMAYENGTAAMMNNPATLGLMGFGDRLDVALGYLGPHVTASVPGEEAKSSADAFFMPAIGWVRKVGPTTFGIGMFSQGGMGTEYGADSFMAAGSNEKVRSELGVGRVLFPVAYNVNKDLTIGGSLDFVWASLDLKMALPGMSFLDMSAFPGSTQTYGKVSGTMMNTFGCAVFGGPGCTLPAGMLNPNDPVNWGRFDFSDKSSFTGKAKAIGYAAKIGGVYKINSQVSVGVTYHSKTALGDLEANGATVSFNANVDNGVLAGGAPTGAGYTPVTIPVTGKIKVKDFQWPQMLGLGVAYQATNDVLLVFDYKWINWADVMKNFNLSFEADSNQSPMAMGFANTKLDAVLFQKWKDQHVFMLGAGYKVTPEWVLRAGLNIANNPIPNTYMNPLFPATEESHITLGTGYLITTASSVDFSFTYAPEVKQKNGQGITVQHYQANAQVMYGYRF